MMLALVGAANSDQRRTEQSAIKGTGGPIANEEACMDTYAFLLVAEAVGLLFVLFVLHARAIDNVRKRDRWLLRLETRLDLLMKSAGVEFDPDQDLRSQVADALSRGENTQAIKLYRSATGGSRKEAKHFIDEILRRSRS
jgi:hypothetical protein